MLQRRFRRDHFLHRETPGLNPDGTPEQNIAA
jgi:hypothetical protein